MLSLSAGLVLFQILRRLSRKDGGIKLNLIDKTLDVGVSHVADYPKGRITPFVVNMLPYRVFQVSTMRSPERFTHHFGQDLLRCSKYEVEGFPE